MRMCSATCGVRKLLFSQHRLVASRHRRGILQTMSTRSKTRLAAASTSKEVPPTPVKQVQKPKSRASKPTQPLKTESDQPEKENIKVKAPKGASKTPSTKKKLRKVPEPVYCTCQKGDDGSPMVFCGGCNVWSVTHSGPCASH